MADFDVGVLMRETLFVILKLGGPPLAVGLAVGMMISLLQAVTQINETTLAFVPKVVAIGAVLLLTGGYMMGQLGDFTRMLFDHLAAAGG